MPSRRRGGAFALEIPGDLRTKLDRPAADDLIAHVDAFVSGGSWDGERVMRISVCGWNTTDNDVARTVAAVGAALTRLR